MLAHLTAAVATAANKTGLIRVAGYDAPPGAVGHIHTVETVDEHGPADCGYDYRFGGAGAFSRLCRRCADQHADMPWVQRCLARSH